MAGIYVHIPFCKQACTYCNFHFSTSLQQKDALLQSLLLELDLRKHYLGTVVIDTIYLGGGTPSLLSGKELERILNAIHDTFSINDDAEITLEANPDDINLDILNKWTTLGINRLSLGIQSFQDTDLVYMNRAHSALEAQSSLELAMSKGFDDLTIDLIYGTPGLTDQDWQQNISKVTSMGVPHISAYCLTVEPKTALAHFIKTGKSAPVNDEQGSRQYNILMEELGHLGYEHYEISNFALPNRHSQHNSSYWKGVPYLGLGPAAHSYNGPSRQWNVSNNVKYIKLLKSGQTFFEQESLSKADQYNEYIMTGLRTMWGCSLDKVVQEFGPGSGSALLEAASTFIQKGWVKDQEGVLTLTQEGKHFADAIAAELFQPAVASE